MGKQSVGGFIGRNSGKLSTCQASGTVVASANCVGSLVGYNESTGNTTSCSATGKIICTGNYVGGLIGFDLSN
mgnify:CR=1 FL=1